MSFTTFLRVAQKSGRSPAAAGYWTCPGIAGIIAAFLFFGDMQNVSLSDLPINPFTSFQRDWFLVTAGDFATGRWNTMTVSWGFLGILWNKPCVHVVIRPQRYTREFLDACDTFTVSAFDAPFHGALSVLGSHSGRDGDKVAAAGLTPMATPGVAAPTFQEARLTFACRKRFRQPMDPASFLDPETLSTWYPDRDYHIEYIGEILAAYTP